MATYAENLTTSRDNLAAILAAETTAALTNGPKPSYTNGVRTFDWNGYRTWLLQAIKDLNDQIGAASPAEIDMPVRAL